MAPPDAFPSGAELVADYLTPLAATRELATVIETGARVEAISRHGLDKVVSRDRGTRPFELSVATADGRRRDLARAVIDVSGTWATPNPLGASGLAADGEAMFMDRIAYRIPKRLGRNRNTYAGRATLVIGAGHSAANALLELAQLAGAAPGTSLFFGRRGAASRAHRWRRRRGPAARAQRTGAGGAGEAGFFVPEPICESRLGT